MKIAIKREQKQTGLILPSVSNLRNAVAKAKFLSVLAVTAILFASCGSDDEVKTEVNDGKVKFSSGVNAATPKVGGADGDQWNADDPIGIYMVSHGTKTIADGVSNYNYLANATGTSSTFKPMDAGNTIYYPVNTPALVDFIAYHPYAASVSNYKYPVDVTNQTPQTKIDLMRAFADNNDGTGAKGYDKTYAGNVSFVFDHKLTKVIFKTKPDAGLTATDLASMTLTIKGLMRKANYYIHTDDLKELSDENDIQLAKGTDADGWIVYEAIVVPQGFLDDKVTVEFALNNAKNEVFEYKVPAKTFDQAEKHIYEVKVQRTGVKVSGTIKSWTPMGTPTTGTAK